MKKKYIAPTTEMIAFDNDTLMEGATSWTTPDGDVLPVVPGNPEEDNPPTSTPTEAKKGLWSSDENTWGDLWGKK